MFLKRILLPFLYLGFKGTVVDAQEQVREIAVDKGANVSIPCGGMLTLPAPNVQWVHRGVKTHHDILSDGSILFVQVGVNDSGLYECLVENETAFVDRINVTVRTEPPPLVNVTVHASTILALILWNVAGDGGHPIIDFTAQYRSALPINGSLETWRPISPNHISPNSRQIDVYHLEPNASYWFRVWANNVLGPGPPVEVLATTLFTDQDVELYRHFLRGAEAFDPRAWRWAVGVMCAALALLAAARRLYFVDEYYGTLETVRLDGLDRAVLAVFAHGSLHAPRIPHVALDETAQVEGIRNCWRTVVWGEAVWCAAGRLGVVPVARRPSVPVTAAPRRAAGPPVRAIVLLHTALYNRIHDDPCSNKSACDESALCLRMPTGHTCVCPDGLTSTSDTPDEHRKCVISFESVVGLNTTCPLYCGPGTCERDGDTSVCRCPPLYTGPRCEQYRCARHCHHRGHCELDTSGKNDTTVTNKPNQLPPLRCICHAGYIGSRCETQVPLDVYSKCNTIHCENGGSCRMTRYYAHCVCPSGYYGAVCEQCAGGVPCGTGQLCELTRDGPQCRDKPCRLHCLNQGTCVISQSGVSQCACMSPWEGARCERILNRTAQPDNRTEQSGTRCNDHVCQHGGTCIQTVHSLGGAWGIPGGAHCACVGPWGGVYCEHYVGYDGPCQAQSCESPTVCMWHDPGPPTENGLVFCGCPEGMEKVCFRHDRRPQMTNSDSGASERAGGGAVVFGAVVALLAFLLAVLTALYSLHRRRHGAFVHARLADNVEINNPMYLAGEDDIDPRHNHTHTNGGNHFANPVYDSMFAPQPLEERANLLAEGSGDGSPPPPERAALL